MQYAAAFLIVIVTLLWGTWAFLSARTAVTKLGPLQQHELTTGEHSPFDIAKVQPDGTSGSACSTNQILVPHCALKMINESAQLALICSGNWRSDRQ